MPHCTQVKHAWSPQSASIWLSDTYTSNAETSGPATQTPMWGISTKTDNSPPFCPATMETDTNLLLARVASDWRLTSDIQVILQLQAADDFVRSTPSPWYTVLDYMMEKLLQQSRERLPDIMLPGRGITYFETKNYRLSSRPLSLPHFFFLHRKVLHRIWLVLQGTRV